MNILEQIKSPADLKYLSIPKMQALATQIRELIIKTVSQNGGHLAPCLGTVELTLALHKVFSCPRDKIVWDVGHQAYTHKILTGRRDKFSTLRKKNGITGFPNRFESIYDAFGAGHASTSISAALGMAVARDLNHENYNVIAVIGDGAMTGGEALEGLNNAGISKRKMIVILNDNEMSIAPNVGALSEYLSLIRVNEKYRRAKKDVHRILSSIPRIGNSVLKTANYVKDSFRNAIVPGGFFESLGFTYIGPTDGNNLEDLINVLEKIKINMDGPVLLHVQTKKGKGYIPAERHPDKFHGIGKFDIATGKPIVSDSIIPTYTAVFSQALVDLAAQDKNITAITAAMPSGTGLQKFSELYPSRFFDVGIAEEHAVTFAAGQATQGKHPIVAIYSTFSQRAYDQIIHDVALQNLPVVLCLDRAGLVGEDGPTHHGVFDMAYIRQIPNMVCMAPKDENELRQMLYSAIKYNSPCTIRYPRGSACGVEIQEEFSLVEKGKGELLSIGDDIAIIAVGSMVQEAIKAREELLNEKINCSVINARFIKPLDANLILATARKVKFIVTVEEGILAGGFGSAVLELLSDNNIYDVPVIRLGIKDKFIEQGTRQEILDECNLNSKSIVNAVKNFINGSDK
jgi:1-deoxy-D-xylulose-5-phosphate synthase